jgi:hypothetical protein
VTDQAGLLTLPSRVRQCAFVETYRSLFRWAVDSALTPVAGEVVQDVGGQWIRLPMPDLTWAMQSAWFIDPTTGDDENVGSTSVTAIKTAAEIRRRLFDATLNQTTTVSVLGDLPEYFRLRCSIANSAVAPRRLVIKGDSTAWTTLVTSNVAGITGVTAINRATNIPTSITDANLLTDPATFLRKRIRLTSGANTNATAWVLKKISATEFRTTAFSAAVDPATIVGLLGVITPAVGDRYVIEDIVGVKGFEVEVRRLDVQDAGGAADSTAVCADSFDVQKNETTTATQLDGNVYIDVFNTGATIVPQFTRSKMHANMVAGPRLALTGCLLSVPSGSSVHVSAFTMNAGGAVAEGGTPTLQYSPTQGGAFVGGDWTSQGVRFSVSSTLRITSGTGMAIFDAATPALDVGTFYPGGNVSAGSPLYGAGNTGVGVAVASAHLYQYSTAGNKPTITGSTPGTNDATVGGVNKAWSAIPFTDTAKMCGIVVV